MTAIRPRTEEHLQLFGDDVMVPQQQDQQLGGFPASSDAWMDGIVDDTVGADAPVDWDAIDSLLNQGGPDIAPYSVPDVQGAPMSADNIWPSEDLSSDFLNSAYMDASAFTSLQLDAQTSESPSFSPQTPSLDQGLFPQDQFAYEPTPGTFAAMVSPNDPSQLAFDQVAAAFKDLARARAEADPRPLSRKQKQRDASIALYLERLRDTCDRALQQHPPQEVGGYCPADAQFAGPDFPLSQEDVDQLLMSWQPSSGGSTDYSASFDNPGVSDGSSSSPESTDPSSGAYSESSGTPAPPPSARRQPANPGPVNGGVEIVMDMNMNTATTLPRKHRPRTQAQRERYLAVRNQGACEKHKKQHKRCTCIDKVLATKPCQEEQAAIRRSRASRNTTTRRVSSVAAEFAPQVPAGDPSRVVNLEEPDPHPHDLGPRDLHTDAIGDSEELGWQFPQSLPNEPQQQHGFVRLDGHPHKKHDVKRHPDIGSQLQPTSTRTSSATNDVRNPSVSNSEVTWDLAAVSHHEGVERQEIRLDKSQSDRRAQNRVLSSATNCVSDDKGWSISPTMKAYPTPSAGSDQKAQSASSDEDYGRRLAATAVASASRQYIGDPLLSSIRENQPCVVMPLSTTAPLDDPRHGFRRHFNLAHAMSTTRDRQAVNTGTYSPPSSSSSDISPTDVSVSSSRETQHPSNANSTGGGKPTGMGRYDISDVSSAIRISRFTSTSTRTTSEAHISPSSSISPYCPVLAHDSPMRLFSTFPTILLTLFFALFRRVHQHLFAAPPLIHTRIRSRKRTGPSSSFRTWFMIWAMLLLFSVMFRGRSPSISANGYGVWDQFGYGGSGIQ